MSRIVVMDDENIYIKQITEYIEQYTKEKNRDIQTGTSCDGSQLLEHYHSRYDIIFLDTKMGELNGMDATREARRMDQDVVLIFITNMVQYAISDYEVRALDYVLRPLNYYTFSVHLERAIARVRKWQTEEVLLNLPDDIERLKAESIHYIEVQNRTLHYHTGEGVFTVQGAPREAGELLRESHFVRCNHWYLANLQHVSKIRKSIMIVASDELEISRRNKTAFLSALTDYMGIGM